MPKLIIKRDSPQRFTRQAILFWVLGLLPVTLLAGFLTGNLISHWQHTSSKAGETPLLPLAPLVQPKPASSTPSLNLPLPLSTPLPFDAQLEKTPNSVDTEIKPNLPPPVDTPSKALSKTRAPEPIKPAKSLKPAAEKAIINSKTSPSINQTNTKNQQNNRNRPIEAPIQRNKPVKSPQTVSESPRSPRSASRPRTERTERVIASPSTDQNERGSTNDYRLLEQSLGIPLQ
ncbi:MAG: hypothetical protein E6Q83_12470 [Thiothrix sp.]|nr:MAG: hypothetical protein E6Q83_12470 [Thiothrix sp.]